MGEFWVLELLDRVDEAKPVTGFGGPILGPLLSIALVALTIVFFLSFPTSLTVRTTIKK